MPTINPHNLRKLRIGKRWSLNDLTTHSHVDRGTISRIETGKQTANRSTTVERLAAALDTDVGTLIGADISTTAKVEEAARKSQMNIRVADDARNALALVSQRYGVKPSHIIHLAPLLFLWAAEESLKQRQRKVDALSAQWQAVEPQSEFQHLHGNITYNWQGEEVMDEEQRSIAAKDIFGLLIADDARQPDYEESEQNPMAQFLRKLTQSLDGLAEFEHCSPFWDRPGYTLGREEASALVGGDEDAVRHIVFGYVALHEMPKDVSASGPAQIAEWVRTKGDAYVASLEIDLENIF